MEKKLDELLRHALTPMEEPDSRLNRYILERHTGVRNPENISENVCQSRQTGAKMKSKNSEPARAGIKVFERKRISAAALTAALIIGAGSLTTFAALKYLTPDKVAEEAGDRRLAEVFSDGKGILVQESQSYGGYQVTLLGIASGEDLSERFRKSGDGIRSDRTYAIVAIENADGSPMKEDAGVEFFVSPLISGCHPAFYNATSMYGNYTEVLREGILYRLAECDNVAIFADRDLYLCVSEGSVFYNAEAYCYDRDTGVISRNEEYRGLNALFRLPIDASGADPEKAEEYILSLGITVPDISEEKRKVELEEDFAVEAVQGNEKGAEAAEYALEFEGNPYLWGGESLTEGCDSSGFTKGVFAYFNISLPHNSAAQKDYGEQVQGLENALPGDLVFYENPGHVGIYIGEGKIVHADPAYGICVSEADYAEIALIKRIFTDAEYTE